MDTGGRVAEISVSPLESDDLATAPKVWWLCLFLGKG